MAAQPLVTIALPVFNGADSVASVAGSVLAQDHPDIEFLISDNASSDGTEEICRELARGDDRVRYERQPTNIGLIANFEWTKQHARGVYLRWIGDNDRIEPDYVSRCLSVYAADPRLILVTTQIQYLTEQGETRTMRYDAGPLGSDDPVTRLSEMLGLLTRTYLLLDPLYGLSRTAVSRTLRHDRMVRGDEVYAAKLALAGPWGHIPQVLAHRDWGLTSHSHAARVLEVPPWQARAAYVIQTRRLLAYVARAELTPEQKRRARAVVLQHYVRRHWSTVERGVHKLRSRITAESG